jgi:hypothetical protein
MRGPHLKALRIAEYNWFFGAIAGVTFVDVAAFSRE